MPKNFKTNDQQTTAINALIDQYKVKNPTATDVDALMEFAASWNHADAAAELPGSADLFAAFDAGISSARDAMTAVARLFAGERETVRQESADELAARDARIAELETALAELREENAELRGTVTAYFSDNAAKDARIAELEYEVEQGEAKLVDLEDIRSMLRDMLASSPAMRAAAETALGAQDASS